MPDIGDGGNGCPLQSKTKGWVFCWNGNVDCAGSLSLFRLSELLQVCLTEELPLRSIAQVSQYFLRSSGFPGQITLDQSRPKHAISKALGWNITSTYNHASIYPDDEVKPRLNS